MSAKRVFIVAVGSLVLTTLAGCTVSPKAPPNVRPGDARSYYMRGQYYHGLGADPSRAIADYTVAIEIDPNYVDAYAKRGIAYMVVDWGASVRDFDKALALLPREHRLYYWRATAHTTNDDIEAAVADHNRVIALKPGSLEAYWSSFNRASALESHGRIEAAIRAYQEFIDHAGSPPPELASNDPSLAAITMQSALGTAHPLGAAVVLGVGVLPALVEAELFAQKNRGIARERIQALTEISRAHDKMREDAPLSRISVGMNKKEVLARTLDDGYYITLKPNVEVVVSRSGNIEDRTLMVLRFRDDTLASRKDFRVSELAALPVVDPQPSEGADRSVGYPGIGFSMGRPAVLERLRQNTRIILEDDDCIAAVGHYPPARDKRILVFNFARGRLTSCGWRYRKLW